MIPQLLKHLIRMQNPLQGLERKADASSRPGFTGGQAGAASRALEGISTKTFEPGMRPRPAFDAEPSDVARSNTKSLPGVAAALPDTSVYEAARIEVDLPPSLSAAPEILFFEEKISGQEKREKRQQGSHLPVLTVRWQESMLVFRANESDFRRMSLEWNGPLPEEGKAFFELLLRLKEYGIEEIYRNGRLISMERQA